MAALQDELRETKRQLEAQTSKSLADVADEFLAKAENVGVKIIAQTIDVSNRDTLRDFIDGLRGGVLVAILLGSAVDRGTAFLTKRLMSTVSIIDEMISGAEAVIRKQLEPMVVD